MLMSLRMVQKPPVIFCKYDPASVIGQRELASARVLHGIYAVPRLWLNYANRLIDDVEPCMEANEGVSATIAFASRYKSLKKMQKIHLHDKDYELRIGERSLFLSESKDGDVFLYFFHPDRNSNRREECRIDLTDFSSSTSAYLIAELFDSYQSIERFFYANKSA